jgi:hypothetical protein
MLHQEYQFAAGSGLSNFGRWRGDKGCNLMLGKYNWIYNHAAFMRMD